MILLLITMISCVCAGTLVVKVKQTHYQAEEEDNITLEWTFTTRSDKFPNLLLIRFDRSTNKRGPTVLHLEYGVELPDYQDEQFSGRVQWDRDVLREGRLRLNVSRLRTNDSGHYKCEVQTRYGQDADHCWLNVTASVAQELHTTPTVNPEPKGQEKLYISVGAGIMSGVIILVKTVGMAAAAAKINLDKVVITVMLVTAALYSTAVCSLAATIATPWAVVGLLLGALLLLAVYAALLAKCICTFSKTESLSHSSSQNGFFPKPDDRYLDDLITKRQMHLTSERTNI